MDVPMNTELITRSMNFHGQQLQKMWEGERGEQDLLKRGVKDLNFMVYGQRQKYQAFLDRGKRLKLQEFISKKADVLFSNEVCSEKNPPCDVPATDDVYAVMPPFEVYLNVDKQQRLRYFFEHVKKGDYILGTIVSKSPSGMMLKVLCTLGPMMRYVADINVKAACPTSNIIQAIDKKGVTRSYMMNDNVCCEVLEVVPDCDKMVCGMKGVAPPPPGCPPLGLVASDDFPILYKKAVDTKGQTYEAVLEKSIGFNNPNNINYLLDALGLGIQHHSNMLGLKGRFPQQEYASELRQVQASKWAFRSVADGIDHFKAGRHTEAFQCLNKALTIDPRNVEGLVARGALYANSGNFQKAISDFETALKLNPSHANARKYMGETLVALGRSYEEENKIDEAKKAYQNCLSIIPFHEEAQNSLEFLKNKGNSVSKNIVPPEDLILPPIANNPKGVSGGSENNDPLKQLARPEADDDKKDKKKKKKSKNRKRRHRSSSSSSSSSSGSSHSSSSSSSSTSDSSTGSSESDSKSKRKKRRSRSHRREKQKSLSPLSKRMAMMDPSHDTPTSYQFNKPAGTSGSFDFGFEQPPEQQLHKPSKDAEYELKVRNFLEQNKEEDSDYEERVRKFLEETARWKKDKKIGEDKKKKKKKDKKAKKESKKKRKEKKIKAQKEVELLRKELGLGKEKRKSKRGLTSDDEEYLLRKTGFSKRLLDSLPDLEELETKLSAYYALEKEKSKSNHSGSSSPGQRFERSPSPTREQKARQAVAEATANAPNVFAPKWKMQIGNTQSSSSRQVFKKKSDREDWDDAQDKPPLPKESPKLGPSAEEKAMSIRKAMAMKEPPPKRDPPPPSDPPKRRMNSPKPMPKVPPVNTSGPVVLDKFGNFRIASPATAKKLQNDDDLPPLPPGAPPPQQFKKSNRPPEPPGPPRTDSPPSRKRRTPSRSRSRTSRSSSRSRSRSVRRSNYRSRSRSYYSRSRSPRSRSRSYYSRSRSRSRSRSGDHRRYRGPYRGRFNDRGTYYKPRLQGYNKNNRGYPRSRGGYRDYRDDRYGNGYRDYRGRGSRGYQNRGGGRRPRGRFSRGGYRDYRDRRYSRRSDSRSVSRDRSYSREADDPMQKVNEEKEKINKYIDSSDAATKHEGPLSEGEDRDDYSNDKYVDRQAYDGKWADKDGEGGKGESGEGKERDKEGIPSETNIEEMDKFLNKVKKEKKEEMLERNKDVLKGKAW